MKATTDSDMKPVQRSEMKAVSGKPSFRSAFRRRRCLIPFDNFYEWRVEGKTTHAYALGTTSNERPDAFAGLWEGWKDPATDEWLHTFTITTTTANEVMAAVHDRMPVILPPSFGPRGSARRRLAPIIWWC